jgi:hypothetical protein
MPIPIPTSGLISYLDFLDPACFTNGGTGATDLSGNGNNWTFRSSATPSALYTYNSSDGTVTLAPGPGNLNCNNSSLMDGGSSYTFSWWFYVDSAGIPDQYVFYKGGYPSAFVSIDTRGNSFIRISSHSGGYLDSPPGSLILDSYNCIIFTFNTFTNGVQLFINNILCIDDFRPLFLNQLGAYPGFMFNSYFTATGVKDLGLISLYNDVLSSGDRTDLYDYGYSRFIGPLPYVGSVGGRRFGGRFAG